MTDKAIIPPPDFFKYDSATRTRILQNQIVFQLLVTTGIKN